jgi:hypothetical protein
VRVVEDVEGRWLRWRFELGSADREVAGRARMARREVGFELPVPWDVEGWHPDLRALAVLLTVQPFLGGRLELPVGVSRQLAAAVFKAFGVELSPVDRALSVRSVRGGVPGLCFSGGVDSTAALWVMPKETVSVFLDRAAPEGEPVRSLYDPSAARYACSQLVDRGRRVVSVSTDLEHVRDPIGFPVDLSNAVPAVILGDVLQLDAIAWGTIAESSYRIGHLAYQAYYRRSAYTRWAPLFASAGLPVLNPVAGVSEVGTSQLVIDSPLGDLAQSCIRGRVGEPCRNCWKCFRKTLLDSALRGVWPSDRELDDLFRIRDARKYLAQNPIKHENVVAYAAGRYPGRHTLLRLLARRVRAEEHELSHLERWYGPSSSPWPDRYRAAVEGRLDGTLGRMSADEEGRLEAWDLSADVGDARREAFAAAYDRLITAHAAPVPTDAREMARLLDDLRTSPSFWLGPTLVRAANRLEARRLARRSR